MEDKTKNVLPIDYEMPDLARELGARQIATWKRVSVWVAGIGILMIAVYWLYEGSQYGAHSRSIKIDRGFLDLSTIEAACQAYAYDHGGRLPDSIEELMLGNSSYLPVDPPVCTDAPRVHFADPHASPLWKEYASFIYLGKGLTTSTPNPKNVIVAYEPASAHDGAGGFFLYLDHR